MANFRKLPFLIPPFGPRDPFIETGPVVRSVEPPVDRVAGGATVTITGVRFRNENTGAPPVVLFGSTPGTNVVVVNETTITVTVPAAAEAGTVSITVTISGQSSTLFDSFTYITSQIISLDPAFGPIAGGTTVIITGANFVTGSTITFGGTPGTSVTFIDDEHYAVVTPNHAQGFVDVVLDEPGAGPAVTLRNGFKYTLFIRGEDIRRQPGITIDDALNNAPNTCKFRIDTGGAPPLHGEKIEIRDDFDGNRLLFAGNLLSSDMSYEDQIDQIVWDVVASDFTWLLNKFRPIGVFKNVSASTIVMTLMANFAPGFTVHHVQQSLAKITISFDGSEDFATCLSNIARAIGGGHWYVDYEQDLHFFHKTFLGEIATVIRNGPGNSMVITEAGPIPVAFSFEAGFYAFRVAFVYSLGFESAMSPLSTFVALQGTNQISFASIPIGASAGTHSVVARRIYMYKVVHSGVVKVEKFVEIPDNTTTAFTTFYKALGASVSTITEIAEDEPLPFVRRGASPGGQGDAPAVQPGIADIFIPQFPPLRGTGLTPSTYNPGPWAFRIALVYRDGSESFPSTPSNIVVLEGAKSARISNVLPGATVNGVPCIARKIYACFGSSNSISKTLSQVVAELKDSQSRGTLVNDFAHIIGVNDAIRLQGTFPIPSDYNSLALIIGFGDLEALLAGSTVMNPPDWSPERTSLWYFIPDNTTTEADIGPGYLDSNDMIPPPGEGIPEWPNPDGPDLENFNLPDPINDANTQLLRDPPVRVSVDLSQIRNRVKVIGAGTSLLQGAFPGATQLLVADTALFAQGGGSIVVGVSQVLRYRSTSTSSGQGVLNLRDVVYTAVSEGEPVSLYFVANDEESQRALARIEVDVAGNPTDGIHETQITDASLTTPFMLFMRAFAELELFGRPIQQVVYATRDSKSRSGATVQVDLTNPPVKGSFLIQGVTIDQVHDESDTLFPRYTVTASTVKFDLNDLLLQIVERTLSTEQSTRATGITTGTPETSSEQFIDRVRGFEFHYLDLVTALGYFNIGPTGSVAATGGASNVMDNRGLWRRQATGTTSGGNVTIAAANMRTRLDHDPVFTAHLRVSPSFTDHRIWCNFGNELNNGLSDTPSGTFRGFGFRWSATAGDVGPRLFTFIGAGTLVLGETLPALQPNQEYVIRLSTSENGTVGVVNINGRIGQIPLGQTLREITMFNGEFSWTNTVVTSSKLCDFREWGAQQQTN